jgi:hypothetical protein
MPPSKDLTKHTVRLDAQLIQGAFRAALSRPKSARGDLFHELRKAFKTGFDARLADAGVDTRPELEFGHTSYLKSRNVVTLGSLRKPTNWTTDIENCARYGHTDYSLKALFEPREYAYLPSLRAFHDVDRLCIGNVLSCVANTASSIEVQLDDSFKLVGCAQDISPRKRKSYIVLLGVEVPRDPLGTVFEETLSGCTCELEDLDEHSLSAAYQYPALFICRRCAKLYTCTCFDRYYDVADDISRFLPYGGSDPLLASAAKDIRTRDGICSLCTGVTPRLKYVHPMYAGRFLQSFYPYAKLYSRRRHGKALLERADEREIENELRERFGYPLVGQGWLTETMLFKIVQQIFSGCEVVHHYRGEEMERLEIDIWVPSITLAIEYQGEQHYEPVAHWGGEEGLKKRQANDKRKRELCRRNGYTLVEFLHDEELTENAVTKKLARYTPKPIVNDAPA